MKVRNLMVCVLTGLTLSMCVAQENPKKVKPPRMSLHVAAIQGNLKAVQQHIAAGSDLNAREPSVGSTPLITAAMFGHTDVGRALIEGGADVNFQNNEGSTALLTAAFFCRTGFVEMLLEKGADKTVPNHRGSTPLQSVSAPMDTVRPVYQYLEKALSPIGLRLDYAHLEKTRPVIADLLK